MCIYIYIYNITYPVYIQKGSAAPLASPSDGFFYYAYRMAGSPKKSGELELWEERERQIFPAVHAMQSQCCIKAAVHLSLGFVLSFDLPLRFIEHMKVRYLCVRSPRLQFMGRSGWSQRCRRAQVAVVTVTSELEVCHNSCKANAQCYPWRIHGRLAATLWESWKWMRQSEMFSPASLTWKIC